jgi:hypothetical protein
VNTAEVKQAVDSVDIDDKSRLLAHLAFDLTITARSTYVPGSDDVAQPSQLRAINEVQHRVTACLSELLDRRGDPVWIWDVVAHYGGIAGAAELLNGAIARAFRSVGRASSPNSE